MHYAHRLWKNDWRRPRAVAVQGGMILLVGAVGISGACEGPRGTSDRHGSSEVFPLVGKVEEIWAVGGLEEAGNVQFGPGPPTHASVHEDGHVVLVQTLLAEVFLVGPGGNCGPPWGGEEMGQDT
jgi:hypothetical protein